MHANQDRLFKVAESQQGYFTTGQAVAAGYPTANQVYHVRTGSWSREYRGIYRLVRFPLSTEGRLVLWSLWSCNRNGVPQGVYSHQTALSLFELSDLMPGRLHLIVPPEFRRNTPVPGELVLHRALLAPADIEQRQGYRVVRPLRAIADLLREGAVSRDHLQQALRQALDRGFITRTALRTHPDREAMEALLAGDKR